MKFLILSDVHNHWENLTSAIEIGNHEHCSHLFFAGDAHSPEIFKHLNTFLGEIHCVYGNNDYPHLAFILANKLHPRVTHHGQEMDITVAGVQIYMSHYPEDALRAGRTARADICIHGHTHRTEDVILENGVRIINPGELCGRRFGSTTFCLYHTPEKLLTHLKL